MKRVFSIILLASGCNFILDPYSVPPPESPPTPSGLTAGTDHTCVIVDGSAFCWGNNLYGQLGNIDPNNDLMLSSDMPVRVSGLPSNVQAIAAGDAYTCAVVNSGAWCWGRNSFGQLGDNSLGADSSVPVQVSGLSSGVQAITAGSNHACAIVNGGAWCWGANTFGQLGNDSSSHSDTPVQVSGLSSGVQAVTAGRNHTCALVNGVAWCWGNNLEGQLGDNNPNNYTSRFPVLVYGLTTGVQAIAAGGGHTCALFSIDYGAGVVHEKVPGCWGANARGQLGIDSTTNSLAPVGVSDGTFIFGGVHAITTGNEHTCLIYDGSAKCWGFNSSGQLGDSSGMSRSRPVQVSGLTSNVLAIAAGSEHTCALVNNRGVRCWGNNSHHQLGNHPMTTSYEPISVSPW